MEMKSTFPKWAWKEIVRFTPLRVTEVSDLDWEKLTPQEEEERNAQQSNDIRAVMDAWENYDPSAWRDEHGRTLELIVTRAVCNEAAEHCQHIRGHLPPGGLARKTEVVSSQTKRRINYPAHITSSRLLKKITHRARASCGCDLSIRQQ